MDFYDNTMTTLYFIPDKKEKAFIAPTDADATLMDVAIVDTAGLVCYVEEMLGEHCVEDAFNLRLCRYYKNVRRWLDEHTDNVMRNSFELAHLSTARQMLLWRDELKMAQWNFRYDDDKTRLGALSAIEKLECIAGLPDRIISVVSKLESVEKKLFVGLRILLNVERSVMRPLLRNLLDAIERLGATIENVEYASDKDDNLSEIRNLLLSGKDERITLDTRDNSLEVLSFETAYDEAEYIAVCQHDFNAMLFINSRSKETDNRLAAQNLPTSGSSITSRSRILNLMSLALSLYDEYLQITKLVEWFTAPIHPLPGRFRFQLAEAIARSGGFLNEDCRNIVDKYINGDYAYPNQKDKELSESDLKKVKEQRKIDREEMIRLFAPYLAPDYRTAENAERTLSQLSVWARQRVHSLEENDNREAIATQLDALSDSIDILMLLFSERDEKFDLSLANEWVRDIPSVITLPQHPARVGSIFTVSQPWDMVSPVSHTVWTNMENEDKSDFECEFLLPTERNAIEECTTFWNREDETRYRFLNTILPFLLTKDKITLMCADKRGGGLIVPHPILTRLKVQIRNYNEFVSQRTIDAKRTQKIDTVDNSTNISEYLFENADRITLPTKMSATGLETFTVYPFDFLFQRILNYQTAGLSSLPELHTTRGKVAHATIEKLFSPREGENDCCAKEIRGRVEHEYDSAFQDAINECGAVFMLPEYKLDLNDLHYQLRRCIESLIEVIDSNSLTVDGCELHYSKFVDLIGKGTSEENVEDLHGYLDMKLTSAIGSHVVFDMKWTRSRSYYKGLLEKNRSTQLAVYSKLLEGEGKSVITAYFVMPWGRLISCYPFQGTNVVKVDPENVDDIMEQLIESFRYRRDQLLSGVVEEGEHHPFEELSYVKDRASRNLFSLPDGDDPETKDENRYSSYRLFKGY